MTLESLIRSPLWENFERQTRQAKKQPADVLAALVEEYLEMAEDVAQTEAMRSDARRSGWREADGVKLVRAHRAEKRTTHAASL